MLPSDSSDLQVQVEPEQVTQQVPVLHSLLENPADDLCLLHTQRHTRVESCVFDFLQDTRVILYCARQ